MPSVYCFLHTIYNSTYQNNDFSLVVTNRTSSGRFEFTIISAAVVCTSNVWLKGREEKPAIALDTSARISDKLLEELVDGPLGTGNRCGHFRDIDPGTLKWDRIDFDIEDSE